MSTYIFILGKDPELSLAELEAKFSGALSQKTPNFALMDMKHELTQQIFDQLGGQIKAARLVGRSQRKSLAEDLRTLLVDGHSKGKLNYGISVYGWPEKNLRPLLLELKKSLKGDGVSSRFANQRFMNISAAQFKKLSKEGKEILVCKGDEEFYLGEVVAVQDIDAYSKRDYKKPFRSMKVGMLPPKLAQIMINLAGDVKSVWDPFCGGGVLIMEGLLMGREMLGSDIDGATLEGARKNVEWIKQEFSAKGKATLFSHDARMPLTGKKYDAVVFEGYLGPPQERMRSKSDLKSLVTELTELYSASFKNLSSFKGPIVAALPFFRCRDGELRLSALLESILKMGFQKEIDLDYARPDQLVGRQVLRFRRF